MEKAVHVEWLLGAILNAPSARKGLIKDSEMVMILSFLGLTGVQFHICLKALASCWLCAAVLLECTKLQLEPVKGFGECCRALCLLKIDESNPTILLIIT